jgi:hypothetical protein
MLLYWLCYQHNNQISVVIEFGAWPIHARMRASLARLDEGTFTAGPQDRTASAEGDEFDDDVSGRSEEVIGQVRVVLSVLSFELRHHLLQQC